MYSQTTIFDKLTEHSGRFYTRTSMPSLGKRKEHESGRATNFKQTGAPSQMRNQILHAAQSGWLVGNQVFLRFVPSPLVPGTTRHDPFKLGGIETRLLF